MNKSKLDGTEQSGNNLKGCQYNMTKTFNLEIELGNDAMQTGCDIVNSLNDVCNKIAHHFPDDEIQRVTIAHRIADTNGNTVGSWRILSS